MSHRTMPPPFRKHLLALLALTAWVPTTSWSLDLVQEPPLPKARASSVAPNVIISIDDSGSMDWGVKTTEDGSSRTGKGYTQPNDDGTWNSRAKRINVLKYTLKTVFNDQALIPENRIRIAWQAMHNNAGSSGAGSVDSSSMNTNSMRPIDAAVGAKTHRDNFLDFVANLKANNGTPSHEMFRKADDYMRRPLSKNSPWSSNPGGIDGKSTEYLGCRRNYHIMMTDGVWNGLADTYESGEQDGKDWVALGGRKAYSTTSDQTRVYRDSHENMVADWAFKSWMEPLQIPSSLKDADTLKPSKIYEEAPATRTFTRGGKTVVLEKYWNPEYNPATWPHMVTYTIGFSKQATEWNLSPGIIAPDEKVPFGFTDGFEDMVTGVTQWPNLLSNNHHKSDSNSDRALDLWHASINGRGRFYAVEEPKDLAKAFSEIIEKINSESAPLPDKITAGGASSGYNISQNNAGLFASVYNAKAGWSGSITATAAREPEEYACPTKEDPAAKCLRFPDPIAAWEGKTTAQRLDELASVNDRLILSWSDKWSSTKNAATGGVSFQWATDDSKLSAAQKALLGKESSDTTATVATKGENILNYLRGDRSLEGSTSDKPFRVRTSRQGDIVNSEIWYTGTPISNLSLSGYSDFAKAQKDRIPMLYVGGNDGMLHGFSAKDGKEKIAYVPRGVIPHLKALTDPNYTHLYYVDGSPMTGDIKDGNTWKTVLVGTLGAGAKGYFALDVTNPAGFSAASAPSLVVLDRTRGNNETVPNCAALTGTEKTACTNAVEEDKDIGNLTAPPVRNPANPQETTQIARLNNGSWAVVMGNGYNSVNQRPVLLVQYLDGNRTLKRIQATTDVTGSGNANDNGLAAPTLVDLNGDGKTDVVYAGDNLGNLWKFDLTSTNDSEWRVAFGTNQPLFTARGPVALNGTRDQVQPITAPPIVRPSDRSLCDVDAEGQCTANSTRALGGMMVAFGTGRNVTADDRRTDRTQNVQTLYSVLDNTRYRMKADKSALEVHPGDCATQAAPCVPAPTPVGTLAADGKPLAKQTITTVSGDFATVTATQELKKETWKDYKGWYVDLPHTGERLLKPMQFYDGSNLLAVYTESPSGTTSVATSENIESCVPLQVDTSAGSQFRTLINIMDGKIPRVPLVDLDGNGVYSATGDRSVARSAVKTGTPLLITKRDRIVDLTGGGSGILARMPEQSMRPSWRQLR